MIEIPFTQYLRPDGRKVDVSIEVSDEVGTKAHAIIAAGYRFECEILTTGQVSVTITDDEADHAIEIVMNGPDIPVTVERLIMNFVIPTVEAKLL